MKIFLTLLLLYTFNIFAQNKAFFCATDELQKKMFYEQPEFKLALDKIEHDLFERSKLNGNSLNKSIMTIPVVVHIIHQNGAENISDQTVFDAIKYINEAFSNSGEYSSTFGFDAQIEFCLAKRDPQGEFTSGINRVESSLTDFTVEKDDLNLKNLSRWDPYNYLNIWVVREIRSQTQGSSVVGYAFLPQFHGTEVDGIVNEASYFGQSKVRSSVLIHEVGHYLGLYHTFQGGCPNSDCQLNGDKICDTPPDQSVAEVNCLTGINSCHTDEDDYSNNNPFRPIANGGFGDVQDQIINFMDYSDLFCQTMFSKGQAFRMKDILSNVRSSLLSSKGCETLCLNPITAVLNSTNTTINVGESVAFSSTSTGASSLSWFVNQSPIGTGAASTYMFNLQGVYLVSLMLSNGDEACNLNLTDTIIVKCPLISSFTTSNTDPVLGGVVDFTSTTLGAISFEWLLDGVVVSNDANWSSSFPNQGGYLVTLVSDNGVCRDSSRQFIRVGNCKSTQGDIWYFGVGMGLDFSSGSPVILTGGATYGNESSSVIQDDDGKLLFYTDGSTVYNKNHDYLKGGIDIGGGASSTTPALIVKLPENDSLYYIFTMDDHFFLPEVGEGLKYSIVNMKAENGLGEVIEKQVSINVDVAERITITSHANGCDYWIMCHEKNNSKFVAYLLTRDGLNFVPVESEVGTPHGPTLSSDGVSYYDADVGTLKFSPNSTKLGLAMNNSEYIEVFDFDNETGVVSNPTLFPNNMAYGLEFSPDNTKIYASLVDYTSTGEIIQIDLTNAPVILNKFPFYGAANLQLASNGVIYVKAFGTANIGAIENPNSSTNPQIVLDKIDFDENIYEATGLPSFPTSYFNRVPAKVEINGLDTVCLGVHQYFINLSGCDEATVEWSFKGPAKMINTSASNVSIEFSSPGTVQLFVEKQSKCGVVFDTLDVFVMESVLKVDLGLDTAICSGKVDLNAGNLGTSYLWQDGSSEATFTAMEPGKYWVSVTLSSGCLISDTIEVFDLTTNLDLDLGPDTAVCEGIVVNLSSGLISGYQILWNDFSTEPDLTAYNFGTYWVQVTDLCGNRVADSITIFPKNIELLNIVNQQMICDSIILIGGGDKLIYNWMDEGIDVPTYTVYEAGTYWLEVVNQEGCSERDTIQVLKQPEIQLDLGLDGFFCEGALPIVLAVPDLAFFTYVWQDGSTGTSMMVNQEGLYWVEATNGCDTLRDEVDYSCSDVVVPDAFTPNGDGVNDVFYIKGLKNEVWELLVLNRWGNTVYQTADYQNNWKGEGLSDGTYFYMLKNEMQARNYQGFFHLFK